MDITASKGTSVPEKVFTMVVYDDGGKVVHKHIMVTFPGGKRYEQQEREARALHLARKGQRESTALQVLHIEQNDIEEGFHYSVDTTRKRLVKGHPIERT